MKSICLEADCCILLVEQMLPCRADRDQPEQYFLRFLGKSFNQSLTYNCLCIFSRTRRKQTIFKTYTHFEVQERFYKSRQQIFVYFLLNQEHLSSCRSLLPPLYSSLFSVFSSPSVHLFSPLLAWIKQSNVGLLL